jgi:hypothetical protein
MNSEQVNRQVRLAKRPADGLVTRDVFSIEDVPLPEPDPGDALTFGPSLWERSCAGMPSGLLKSRTH